MSGFKWLSVNDPKQRLPQMITAYRHDANLLTSAAILAPDDPAVWIDLRDLTPEEEVQVEGLLNVDIPTREEMQEIELSSRLYHEAGALYLTAGIVATGDGHDPVIEPVTFVLAGERLVTLRYHEPRSFAIFADRASRLELGLTNGGAVLLALLETVVDRLADLLEAERRKLDALSKSIFDAHRPGGKTATLAVVLQRIGRAEDLNGKIAESLTSLERLVGFLSTHSDRMGKVDRAAIKTLSRDIRSLVEFCNVQNQKILFQLDATLGVINIRQADIIKIFSVVAFVFLPPTLIASIYGMNFAYMPELEWRWGYPAALVAMLVSAVVPYLLFKAKGWLR
jgi:magnesium transporter